MDNSPVGSLPPEVRNMIYDLVLQQERTVLVGPRFKDECRKENDSCSLPGNALALTQTCREVRSESFARFYKLNHFRIRLRGSSKMLHRKRLSPTQGGDYLLRPVRNFLEIFNFFPPGTKTEITIPIYQKPVHDVYLWDYEGPLVVAGALCGLDGIRKRFNNTIKINVEVAACAFRDMPADFIIAAGLDDDFTSFCTAFNDKLKDTQWPKVLRLMLRWNWYEKFRRAAYSLMYGDRKESR